MPRLEEQEREMCILVNDQDAAATDIFGSFGHTHYTSEFDNLDITHAKNVFVISSAVGLESISRITRQANDARRLRAFLIREEAHQNWVTRILDRINLRTLRNMAVHSGYEVPIRILTAWKYGQEHKLIADAAVFGDSLFVLDCAMDTYELPFDALTALKSIPKDQRDHFVVSEEGSHISWPRQDVDIDLESIKVALCPEEAEKSRAKAMLHDQWLGEAIERLRKSMKLKQSEISGLSDRQVRRIETGEQHASVESLEHLAKAHKMNLNNYLSKLGELAQEIKKEKQLVTRPGR